MKLVVRDARENAWLCFEDAREVVTARRVEDVAHALERAEECVAGGAWAAGFIGYEAAPAFDHALTTRAPGDLPLLMFGIFNAPRRVEPSRPRGACEIGPWSRAMTRDAYFAAIERIRAHIAAGDTYQVNFTLRQHAEFQGDPEHAFARLADAARPRYGAFVDAGRFAIASLSPELFFTLDDGVLASLPMKGTAGRALSFADDQAVAERLARCEKNRAENVMIVDMVRNDIGRIARAGSVRVPSLFSVERHATVWQMTSTVEGRTDAGLAGIMRALFAPASVTGAPKRRAMEIIAELEDSPRGIYT
ncbi:MAG TPA: chorismate-binding protein, partial [Candidatus Krumholzibacteria bacterium]